MGDLTGAQLVTRVKRALGLRDAFTITDIDDTNDVLEWLNLAQTRIARSHHFKELRRFIDVTVTPVGTPATDQKYTLSNVRSVRMVRVTQDGTTQKLTYKPQRQFFKSTTDPANDFATTSTKPTLYTEVDSILYLYRIPTNPYDLEVLYDAWPTPLLNDGTPSDLDKKDDLIINLASSIAFHELGMSEDGNKYYGIYKAMYDEAVEVDNDSPDREVTNCSDDSTVGYDPVTDPFVRRM